MNRTMNPPQVEAPIVMDTGRPEGRAVGMESGTGAEEGDGDALLEKNEKEWEKQNELKCSTRLLCF